jgi:Kef-type K+ transport system membrane component KefB
MYLSLADVLVNFHLNAFESTVRSIMAKVNDIVVFFLSYFPFVYSGLVLDPKSRYEIGWFQVTLIAIMFIANVGVVIFTSIIEIMREFRRVKVEKFNF